MKALLLVPILCFALNTRKLQCEKMGEYCFDPQVGLYKPEDVNKAIKEKAYQLNDEPGLKKVKGLGANGIFNQKMLVCDQNNIYDIYCED